MTPVGGSCPTTSTDPAITKLRAGLAQVALPADFHPVAAVRCESQVRAVPGDGEWQFADAQRAESGLADLVTALRLPSVTSGPNTICPAIGLALPPFALVDASGRVINPLLPHNECGFPLPQVMTAMNALPWHTETEQRLTQTRTQAEIDTGCSGQYKYMFEHQVSGTPEPWNSVRRPGSSQPATACIYTIQWQTPDNYVAVGSFIRGVKFNPAQQTTITNALNQVSGTAAPACTVAATQFAVLDGPAAGTLVELDGCRRMRWPNGFKSPAPAALLQLLASAGKS